MVYWHREANGCADGLAKRGKESKHAVIKPVLIKPLCVQLKLHRGDTKYKEEKRGEREES